ncbi:MAG: DNA polymerase [Dehalococcoidia bacterium]
MKFIVFDVEGTGLDPLESGLHCIATKVHGVEGSSLLFDPGMLDDGIRYMNAALEEGAALVGLNIVEYDLPLLYRFGLNQVPEGQVYDLKLASRTIYPGNVLAARDLNHRKRFPEMPVNLVGWHSLKAWGYRLFLHKGEYDLGWENYSPEMGAYCVQDVEVSDEILSLFRKRINDEAVFTESEVGRVCRAMRLNGVGFDRKTAEELTAELADRRAVLATDLQAAFPPRFQPAQWETAMVKVKGEQVRQRTSFGRVWASKRDLISKKYPVGDPQHVNYRAGAELTKVVLEEFNPASTQQACDRLKIMGWKPKEFTKTGIPQLTGDILRDLDPVRFPQAPLLGEYQDIKKIIGYIAEGDNAWLKLEQHGKVHGRINPVGTSTLRASHYDPNTGQVPVRSEYGLKCRAMFRPTVPGNKIVGADASGLQLRAVGHYLAPMDGGEFAVQCRVPNGPDDIHNYMRKATHLNARAFQKTWTYAKLFGAQAKLLGMTVIDDMIAAGVEEFEGIKVARRHAQALGQQSLDNFGQRIPAWPLLEQKLDDVSDRGWLRTLNGQRVPVPSRHLSIAILLQAFEACIMKRAMRIAARYLRHPDLDCEWMLWVHDEFQVECPPEQADHVGDIMVESMRRAGEELECLVVIDAGYQVGDTWADTH